MVEPCSASGYEHPGAGLAIDDQATDTATLIAAGEPDVVDSAPESPGRSEARQPRGSTGSTRSLSCSGRMLRIHLVIATKFEAAAPVSQEFFAASPWLADAGPAIICAYTYGSERCTSLIPALARRDVHSVFCQSAGLVSADNGGGSERLDGRQPLDQRAAARYLPDADSKCQGDVGSRPREHWRLAGRWRSWRAAAMLRPAASSVRIPVAMTTASAWPPVHAVPLNTTSRASSSEPRVGRPGRPDHWH